MDRYKGYKTGIITLSVGHWDLMDSHLKSVYEQFPYEKEFYIIPNLQYEWSLSAAINRGFKRAIFEECDVIVYCADDVTIGPNSIETLIDHLFANELWMVNAVGANTSGWDFFVMNPEVFSKVGFWDEEFYPAYFEDNDFARRMTLKAHRTIGKDMWDYIPVEFSHLGSQTVRRMNQAEINEHHVNFTKNQTRYVQKWGGMPGQETYEHEWNIDYSKYPGM